MLQRFEETFKQNKKIAHDFKNSMLFQRMFWNFRRFGRIKYIIYKISGHLQRFKAIFESLQDSHIMQRIFDEFQKNFILKKITNKLN